MPWDYAKKVLNPNDYPKWIEDRNKGIAIVQELAKSYQKTPTNNKPSSANDVEVLAFAAKMEFEKTQLKYKLFLTKK